MEYTLIQAYGRTLPRQKHEKDYKIIVWQEVYKQLGKKASEMFKGWDYFSNEGIKYANLGEYEVS